MAIISFLEILYLVITTLVVGFIFSGYIRLPSKKEDDLLNIYKARKFIDWEAIKLAAIVAAPGIILHELGHKFVALLFGLKAIYQVFWLGLGLGFLLKLAKSPFLILAPGFVEISGNPTLIQGILTSFAGPFINLVLWIGSLIILKSSKRLNKRATIILMFTKQVNMILFIFNILPIPPLDGFKFWYGLYQLII